MIKVFVLQEVLPDFRIPFFNRLGEHVDLTVFYSKPTQFKKRNSTVLPANISFKAKLVSNFQLFKGALTFHPAMLQAFFSEAPEFVILEPRLGFLTGLFMAVLPRKRRRIAWWLSGYETPTKPLFRHLKNVVWSFLYGRADAFICYSTHAARYLERFDIYDRKFIAFNSVDTDAISVSRERVLQNLDAWHRRRAEIRKSADLLLLFVGRLEPAKQLQTLLAGLKFVIEKNDSIKLRLICIGAGSELVALEAYVRQLSIEENVEFIGAIYEQSVLAEYFLASDIFVLPGVGGLAISQAISYGLPVILSGADGSEQDLVQDCVNGLYFDSGRPEILAEKLLLLAHNKKLLESMSTASLKIAAESSNMTRMLDGFMKAIEFVLKKRIGVSPNADYFPDQVK